MDVSLLLKFNPNHDRRGRFTTAGLDNAEFSDTDRRLIDIKPSRPLGREGGDDLVTIESLIPGARVVPYSKTPFFAELQRLQGVDADVTGAANKNARAALMQQQPIEDVPFSKLIFTQNVVSRSEYEKFDPSHPLHDPVKAAGAQPADVVRWGDDYYVMDGHHRTVSEWLKAYGTGRLRAHVLHLRETTRKREDVALKFNPWHDQLGRFTFAGGSGGYFPGAKGAGAAARDLLDDVSAIEPRVSADMQEIAAATQGQLSGFEFRLKSEKSLTRKIHDIAKIERRPIADVAAEINDAIRYTMIFDTEHYSASYRAADEALRQRGYAQIKHKDNWNPSGSDPNFFIRGITNAYVDSKGHKIQVLFHTPESQAVKDQNHLLYETSRLLTTSAELRAELERQMRENAKRVRIPR